MKDARALDEVANDLAADYVLNNHAFYSCCVHSIIQRGHAARSRQRSKPAAESRLFGDYLAHEDVRPLRAPTEATLPHQLRALARVVRLERRSEHLVKRRGLPAVAALRASAHNDLETTWRQPSFEGTRLVSR